VILDFNAALRCIPYHTIPDLHSHTVSVSLSLSLTHSLTHSLTLILLILLVLPTAFVPPDTPSKITSLLRPYCVILFALSARCRTPSAVPIRQQLSPAWLDSNRADLTHGHFPAFLDAAALLTRTIACDHHHFSVLRQNCHRDEYEKHFDKSCSIIDGL